MASTDEHVKRLDFDAKAAAKRARVPTVTCAIVGSTCTKIHFVHVPVDIGCERDPRPEDLKYEQYIDVESTINGFAVDMDDFTVEYDGYPRHGLVSSYRWTVFSSDHRQEKLNTLIPTFYGADVLTQNVYGSFLVAKSDRDGIARNVCREDLQLIRDLVVDSIVTRQTLADAP